ITALVILSSCSKNNVSSKTGWKYNDINNGGFEVNTNYNEETGPGLVFVEGGTFTMGRVDEDLVYDWNNPPRRVTVSSFYMDETEITNTDYLEYLYWLKRVFVNSDAGVYSKVYRDALPDTLVWRDRLAYNEPFVDYYLRHPAYANYPVVGVSWLQANEYCKWRTDRVNENILINKGILEINPNQAGSDNFNTDAYFAGQYEGLVRKNLPNLDPNVEERKARMEDGILLPRYRLPTEAEWEFAALSNVSDGENISDRRLFPWRGNTIRNDDKKNYGKILANNTRGRGDLMGVSGALNDKAGITSPVKTYWPNDFGLYDMSGNVNEWVMDVYRPLSYEDFAEFRPFRGNVFETKIRDSEGYLVEKDSLGRIPTRAMSIAENLNRRNYLKSNNKNYLDGDLASSINFNDPDVVDSTTSRMYHIGKGKDEIFSRISDQSRVYKGGSWRDRAYWLIPGTRRYLDERASKDDLGFRCAMTHLGGPSKE
ncbi:gliding motility lipoprotein GldJ, partial [Bacteroidota bacterium]